MARALSSCFNRPFAAKHKTLHMRMYSVLCISTAWRVRQRFLVFVSHPVRGLVINLRQDQIRPSTAYPVNSCGLTGTVRVWVRPFDTYNGSTQQIINICWAINGFLQTKIIFLAIFSTRAAVHPKPPRR